jgi:hypothetical protein
MTTRELERQSELREKAFSIPEGTPVEVRTSQRRRLRGALCSADDDTVRLRHDSAGASIESVWLFDEIVAIRRADRSPYRHLGLAHRVVTFLLAALMGLPLSAADLRAKALDIPVGAMVELKSSDDQKIRGRMGPLTTAGITLHGVGPADEAKTFRFDDLKALRRVGSPESGGSFLLKTVGVIWLVSVVVVLATLAGR